MELMCKDNEIQIEIQDKVMLIKRVKTFVTKGKEMAMQLISQCPVQMKKKTTRSTPKNHRHQDNRQLQKDKIPITKATAAERRHDNESVKGRERDDKSLNHLVKVPSHKGGTS